MAFFKRDELVILLIGNGGREHALAWKLAESSGVKKIFVAPGNGGTASFSPKVENISVKATDFDGLLLFAQENNVNFVVPGPEQPLVDGIKDVFVKAGIPVFGPSAHASTMEGSKTFSKDFMARHNIPTARYANFSDFDAALAHLNEIDYDVVLKASGLAAGKGVIIPQSKEEAVAGLKEIMVSKNFGAAGDEVVIEECLTGPELSFFTFSDGYTALTLPPAQDHKRIGNGDTGPNTGGMGAYSPAPVATAEIIAAVDTTIIAPTIAGMRRDGFPFVGLLFTGVMLTAAGPKVLEYNVRFGDPETEVLLPLLAPGVDLADILWSCAHGHLDSLELSSAALVAPHSAVTVVMASAGYPGKYSTGVPITIGALPENVFIFQAGTAVEQGQLVTAGGRVLTVTAIAGDVRAAQALAYEGVKRVQFEGAVYRTDIGYRALVDAPVEAGLTYAAAGVSVDNGNALVERIKPIVKTTQRVGSDTSLGGFGGIFDLKACGFRDPVLVAGTDGVGTKLKVAQGVGRHDTIGIDLVAMSVNDLIVQGAEPLFFLDYFACGALDVATATEVVRGVAAGCRDAGCALIGGETAEMPSLYAGEDYDAAGFAVGAVERDAVLPRPDIAAGDIVLGLASSGVHSNGFSLVRAVIDKAGATFATVVPEVDAVRPIGEVILEPTAIYVRQLLPAVNAGLIKGLSHITGGGFTENVPRVLPAGVAAEIDGSTFPFLPIFSWLKKAGNITAAEMARTFNCGIGMVIVVAADKADEAVRVLGQGGLPVYTIGRLVAGEGCTVVNTDSW